MSDALDLTADDTAAAEQHQQQQREDTQTQSQSQPQEQEQEDGHVDVFSSQQALAPIRIRLNKVDAPPRAPPAAAAAAASSASAAAAAASNSAASAAAVAAAIPSLHLLPCRIAHTGPANIPNYFQPERSDAANTMLTYGADGSVVQQCQKDSISTLRCLVDAELYDARFRGRQLTGSILTLPASAQGFIFEDDERAVIAEAQAIELDADPEQESSSTAKDSAAAAPAPQTTRWKTASTFHNLMLWQPDQELFERKHIREVIEEWAPIAHAIHEPIED